MSRSCCCTHHYTRYSHCIGYSALRMLDNRLRRPMSDGPLLVQCI